MPIYQYACKACEREFEELVRSTADERAVRCPECGAARIERRLSTFAAHGGRPTASNVPLPRGGGCGRCGDPQGPCGL